jgi:hypothetical protein
VNIETRNRQLIIAAAAPIPRDEDIQLQSVSEARCLSARAEQAAETNIWTYRDKATGGAEHYTAIFVTIYVLRQIFVETVNPGR